MAFNPAYADAISSIESGGRYGLLGPVTKSGDRAYGKYQVMGSNIPSWTEQFLGIRLTPQQFLNSPQAQDAVFAGKFGQLVNKYGNPQDAASAWFTGQPLSKGANKSDILGTTGASYVAKFNRALGQPAPMQVASAPQAVAAQPAATPQAPQAQIQPQPQTQPSPLQSQAASPFQSAPMASALSGLAGLFAPQQQVSQQPPPAPVRPPPVNLPLMRRPPDLSGLAQLLQSAPASVRGLIV